MTREPDDDLFLRFRRDGDPGLLARLFDRTAPELLRIARHVAANPQEAEDLLQATFLTALEKAGRFEAGRRVRPWLVGILVRHAHAARRRGRRSLEVERVETIAPRDPGSVAAERELESEVERALDALPAHVREIVEPRVREGARGPEIARRVGRRPDTVRVQLSRGLSLLRGMLPAGIAGGLLLSASARKSLAAVRGRVLEQAVAGGAAPLPSAGLFSLGGLLVVNKILIGVGAIVLVAAATRLLWSDGEPAGLEDAPSVAVASPTVPPSRPPSDAGPERVAASPAAADVAEPSGPAPAPPPPAAETAGLTGRLLLDGAPVEGTEVTLLRVAVEELTGNLARTLLERDDAPLRACGCSTTDAEGRFSFDHAPTHSVLALGVDLGGGRATVRAVLAALAPDRTASVGDVELGPVTALSGRVVDEEDRPIAGATVRAVHSPVPIGLVGGEGFRPDAVVVRGDDEVTPLPEWVEPWWIRFPAPRAVTDVDGRFTLGGVSRGVVSLVVHAEGRRPIAKATPTGNVPARDVGELRLDAGRTLEGRVLDAAGAPIEGAAVFAGVHSVLADCAFAAPAVAPTDAEGRFSVRGLPEFGDLAVAVRAGPRDGFRVDRPGDVEEVELRLAPTTALVVDLVGVELPELGRVEVTAVRAGGRTPSLGDGSGARHAADAAGGRRFVFDGLRPGEYVVLVAVDGAARPFPVELPPGGTSIEVTPPTPTPLDVRVVDDASGAPIPGATVRLRRLDVRPAHPVEGVTGDDGTVVLGPLSFDGVDTTRPSPRLVTSHPAYGRAERRLDAAPDGVVEVRFSPTGSVEGRVTIAGEPPSRPLMVTVYEDDGFLGFMTGVPTLVTTDARGAFEIPALAAGSWIYRVGPRYLVGDLAAALPVLTSPPESIASGGFEVRAGETTTVEIDAITADSAVACKVVGRVTLDGRPLEDARVFVHPLGRPAESGARGGNATTDVTGAYEIDTLPPGRVRFVVHRVERTERGFHMNEVFERDVELRPGGVLPLDVALRTTRVEFVVVGADGAPAHGVELSLSPLDEANAGFVAAGSTDAEGGASIEAYRTGRYRVSAYHQRIGAAELEVELPAAEAVRVRLEPGVPCRGTFSIPDDWAQDGVWFPYLGFRFERAGRAFHRQVLIFPGETRSFDVKGLSAGPVDVQFLHEKRASRPIRIVLPPAGSEAIELKFEKP